MPVASCKEVGVKNGFNSEAEVTMLGEMGG